MWKRGVYGGWEKASKEFRFVYGKAFSRFETPSSPFNPGTRTCYCGQEQASACNAFCCSGGAGVIELSPLEIAIISNKTQKPPSEFLDYGEIISVSSINEPTKVSPLFAIKTKKENGRCSFNDETHRCEIYEFRPMSCRVYPYMLDGGELEQKKACAGYKRGHPASKKEFESIKKLVQVVNVTAGLIFTVDLRDWELGNKHKMLKETLANLGLPYNEPVQYFNLDNLFDRLMGSTNLSRRLELTGLDKESLLGYLCTGMNSPVKIMPEIVPEQLQMQPVTQPSVVPERILQFQPLLSIEEVKSDEATQQTRPLLRAQTEIEKDRL